MKKRDWTKAEDQIVQREYPDTLTKTLAKRLNRSVEAVRKRAQINGVKKTKEHIAMVTKKNIGRGPDWVPIGTYRFHRYLQIKIADAPKSQKNWKNVHVLLWEKQNGPTPKGHVIAFRDGNKKNICYANLALMSKAEMCKKNNIHKYPPALKEAIWMKARLTKAIKNKEEKCNEK